MEEFEIDRSAIVAIYKQQNLNALTAAMASGEWTPREADLAHIAFMESDILQTLVTQDVVLLEAMLKGQVH